MSSNALRRNDVLRAYRAFKAATAAFASVKDFGSNAGGAEMALARNVLLMARS
jgi:hypothetical protein